MTRALETMQSRKAEITGLSTKEEAGKNISSFQDRIIWYIDGNQLFSKHQEGQLTCSRGKEKKVNAG